ncbi:MAG: ABC transporter permease [Planctomycetes bacterium]|nr:ABC transporter permease [Planctomycetota bacterium]MBI3832801.1 ABC transporter permease [Planctomycetota bacterium]
MTLLAVIAESLKSLGKNKLQTMLSILGIVIGVASVITVVAVGQGTRAKVEEEIASLGDDWMSINYVGMPRAGVRDPDQLIPPQRTQQDAEAILRECPSVRAATPTNGMRVQVSSAYSNYLSRCYGGFPSIFDIRRYRIENGRELNEIDEANQAKVVCIGQTTARELFGSVDPVGETIRANKVPFEIVGLLSPKGRSSDGRDYDDVILFPWNCFQTRIAGKDRSETLLAAARPGIPLSVAKTEITALLRERHPRPPGEPDDFRMFDYSESATIKAQASETFNIMLIIVACVSLLVGGVGIMNIMLMSVTERTREIGLRLAVGAPEAAIIAQFLTEAVMLCLLGGALGVAAGIGTAQMLSRMLEWLTIVPVWSVAVAAAFSVGIGLVFGFYPAWRASRMNPIEALRVE